jgi:hypothetical protein
MGGADLMDAFSAVGRACHSVQSVIWSAIDERASSPQTFYPKVFTLLLIVGWFGRYWGTTATVALMCSACLWIVSDVPLPLD